MDNYQTAKYLIAKCKNNYDEAIYEARTKEVREIILVLRNRLPPNKKLIQLIKETPDLTLGNVYYSIQPFLENREILKRILELDDLKQFSKDLWSEIMENN